MSAWLKRWWKWIAATVAGAVWIVVTVFTLGRRRRVVVPPTRDPPPVPEIDLGKQPEVNVDVADDYRELADNIDDRAPKTGDELVSTLNDKFGG